MRSRLDSVERRYHELLELTELRKQRLLDALALYKLYNDADGVEQWIAEKACIFIVILLPLSSLDCSSVSFLFLRCYLNAGLLRKWISSS